MARKKLQHSEKAIKSKRPCQRKSNPKKELKRFEDAAPPRIMDTEKSVLFMDVDIGPNSAKIVRPEDKIAAVEKAETMLSIPTKQVQEATEQRMEELGTMDTCPINAPDGNKLEKPKEGETKGTSKTG